MNNTMTHFTKQTLTLLFTADAKCNGPEKRPFFRNLNFHSMVATSSFGSLSALLYTSDLKWL